MPDDHDEDRDDGDDDEIDTSSAVRATGGGQQQILRFLQPFDLLFDQIFDQKNI